MKTTIKNNIIINEPTTEIIEYCKNNLILPNPQYNQNKALGFSTWNVAKELYLYSYENNILTMPFGLIRNIYPLIKNSKIDFEIKPVVAKKLLSRVILREYQNNALNGLKNAKNGVLVAPCGVGKTNIGLELASDLQQKTLWLTHTRELLKQSKERAKEIFINIEDGDLGEISEGKVNIGNVITFATVQTMAKLDLTTLQNEWGCAIVDECAHCVGSEKQMTMFYKVVDSLSARYKFGLTATPKRKGYEKSMYALLGEIAYEISDDVVANNKIKARLKYVELPTEDSPYFYKPLTKQEREEGELIGKIDAIKLTTYLTTRNARNDVIINEIYHQHSLGKKQLVMSDRVKHCEKLFEILNHYNTLISTKLKVALFIGGNGKVNSDIRNHYKDYDVIITTYAMSKEGLDMPEIDTLHLTTPKSDNQMLKQCVGRVERFAPNKDDALVIAYRDFNIRYCNRCCDNVRQAMGIRKKGYDFS